MRITLVISGMGAGGAERVMKTLADAWVERGQEVTLITLARVDEDYLHCDPRVARVGLAVMAHSRNLGQAVRRNLGRVQSLRRAIIGSRPDVVVSFNDKTNVLTLLACRSLGCPVIPCEHIDPYRHDIGRLWAGLRQVTYPRAAAVVGVTGAAEQFVRRFVTSAPVLTLPNPVLPPALPDPLPPRPWAAGPTLIAMGRLNAQKGFGILLGAIARLAAGFPPWRAGPLGEGEERAGLEARPGPWAWRSGWFYWAGCQTRCRSWPAPTSSCSPRATRASPWPSWRP
ncbi:MAG: glycosyltransferase [Syntrophales bacterium LBB04]|nr:glycosyltransferase [Syntrophales bacterium LBB04]